MTYLLTPAQLAVVLTAIQAEIDALERYATPEPRPELERYYDVSRDKISTSIPANRGNCRVILACDRTFRVNIRRFLAGL